MKHAADSLHVVVMAGGTGGHVFPALAVADVLRQRGCSVSWLGTRQGIESRLVPAAGIAVDWLEIGGLRGKGWQGWLAAPWRLGRAIAQALAALRARRPALVLGLGGFVAGPGGVAARLAGVPLVIHEQNAVAGLTNRVLARLSRRVLAAFPTAFRADRALVTGNPVRADIAALPAPAIRFSGRSGPARLFVFGGSQGAAALNRLLPAALGLLPADLHPVVLHQAGRGAERVAAVREAYAAGRIVAEVREFVDDMAGEYAAADLVVCRAGALTVSELAAAGVGAMLVPLSTAVDDHQTANASWLVSAHAAQLVDERGLSAAALAARLQAVLAGGRAEWLRMAEAARGLAVTDAAERVADICLEEARR
jgi:UDP-N-acetylglucosamine--N-acetylmuramyl-(pentapeptide) pyrophosphoryl-undecaprenol N-acetylglucosamine transferase